MYSNEIMNNEEMKFTFVSQLKKYEIEKEEEGKEKNNERKKRTEGNKMASVSYKIGGKYDGKAIKSAKKDFYSSTILSELDKHYKKK